MDSTFRVLEAFELPIMLLVVFFILLYFNKKGIKKPKCSKCGILLKNFRTPASAPPITQAGWDCNGCGAKLDIDGKPLEIET